MSGRNRIFQCVRACQYDLLTETRCGTQCRTSVVADIPFSEHLSSVYVRIDRNDSNWIFIGACSGLAWWCPEMWQARRVAQSVGGRGGCTGVVQENWMDYADASGNYVVRGPSSIAHVVSRGVVN
jgi:hypothetical protein